VVDAHPKPAVPKQIALRHHKVGELLGVSIAPAEQIRLLKNLGLQPVAPAGASHVPMVAANVDTTTLLNKEVVSGSAGGTTVFEIPSFRVDLKREVDLIEEIARLHGVEKISSTPPRGAIGSNAFDSVHDQIGEARRLLCGLGLNEAQGQTLIGNAECRMPNADLVAMANPLSADMDVLRPSLLPGLIHSLRHNVSRKNYDIALFEVGRVFQRAAGVPPGGQGAVKE